MVFDFGGVDVSVCLAVVDPGAAMAVEWLSQRFVFVPFAAFVVSVWCGEFPAGVGRGFWVLCCVECCMFGWFRWFRGLRVLSGPRSLLIWSAIVSSLCASHGRVGVWRLLSWKRMAVLRLKVLL